MEEAKIIVRLDDDSVGQLVGVGAFPKDFDFEKTIGHACEIILSDENGNKIEKKGIIVEILEQ
jgi:hypothetical protein